MIFYEKKENLEYLNLVRYRDWVCSEKMRELSRELNRVILKNNAKKCGPLITCTHRVRKKEESFEMDIEIMVPIDRMISLPLGFAMCEKFSMKNIMDIHIVSKKHLLKREMEEAKQYIIQKRILPQTSIYSVIENEEGEQMDVHLIFGL